MRIISKFKDYYDSVQKQGMDSEVLYIRDSQILDFDFNIYKDVSSHYVIESFILGFCGNIYKCFRLSYDDLRSKKIEKFYFDIESNIEEFKKDSIAFGFLKESDFNTKRWSFRYGLGKFLNSPTSDLSNIFHKHQVPVFLIRHRQYTDETEGKTKLVLNPKLQTYGVQSFKDTYTCYQEIFQYVSGVLNHPENKMVTISNNDKISKHGFDKWSFRKQSKEMKK